MEKRLVRFHGGLNGGQRGLRSALVTLLEGSEGVRNRKVVGWTLVVGLWVD
jgi:hypothetical protein